MANIKEISDMMKNIQNNLLIYIENEDNLEENYQNLIISFDEYKVKNNKNIINSILHMIAAIANNHHRGVGFFSKLEKILLFIKCEIRKNFSNKQIFSIFDNNKRLLLFFINEKIMIFDDYIYEQITSTSFQNLNYTQYFQPEIKSFLSKKDDKIDEEFNNKRLIGENDDYICSLIQKDAIEDFIIYVKKYNYSLHKCINPSIFETNEMLLKRTIKNYNIKEIEYNFPISLIEYAAFFGSTQIFKYLYMNGVALTQSLWSYAIHGLTPEIISILDENKILPESYELCLIDSIKCHHNYFGNYFESNYLKSDVIDKSYNIFVKSLKQYNFAFINDYFICQASLYKLIKYDYPLYIEMLLMVSFIDQNHVNIWFIILIKF